MSERVWAPPPACGEVWAPWRAETAAALVFLHSDKKGSSGGLSGQDWGCSSTCLQSQGWLLLDYRGPTQNMQQVSPGTGTALAVVYHYFLKGVEAGLQITRAKLFHTVHHLERNRTGVPWPQVMWHQWGCGSWMLKIFSKMMNLRGQKVPKLIQSSLCCLLGILLRAAPKAELLPFTWLRQQCWTLTPAHLLSAGPDSAFEAPPVGWCCQLCWCLISWQHFTDGTKPRTATDGSIQVSTTFGLTCIS